MYRNDVHNIFCDDVEKYIKNNKYALKLVRGAYISTDKQHNIILSSKEDTDTQYNYILNFFFSMLHEFPQNEIIIAIFSQKKNHLYYLKCFL